MDYTSTVVTSYCGFFNGSNSIETKGRVTENIGGPNDTNAWIFRFGITSNSELKLDAVGSGSQKDRTAKIMLLKIAK